MDIKLAALKFGSRLIEAKLAGLADPNFYDESAAKRTKDIAELPTNSRQKREQSAKIHPPRVINPVG